MLLLFNHKNPNQKQTYKEKGNNNKVRELKKLKSKMHQSLKIIFLLIVCTRVGIVKIKMQHPQMNLNYSRMRYVSYTLVSEGVLAEMLNKIRLNNVSRFKQTRSQFR